MTKLLTDLLTLNVISNRILSGGIIVAGTQVRISTTTHRVLRSLSSEAGESMQTIVEEAIEQYRRRKFLKGLNQDFKTLKEDSQAWKEELEERLLWDKTLLDGAETK